MIFTYRKKVKNEKQVLSSCFQQAIREVVYTLGRAGTAKLLPQELHQHLSTKLLQLCTVSVSICVIPRLFVLCILFWKVFSFVVLFPNVVISPSLHVKLSGSLFTRFMGLFFSTFHCVGLFEEVIQRICFLCMCSLRQ